MRSTWKRPLTSLSNNRNSALLSGLEDQQIKLISNMPEDLLSAEKSIKADLETTKMDLYYEKSAESPNKEFSV